MTHDRAAFMAFNAANRRAAADYYARPTRNCQRPSCDRLAADGPLCDVHLNDNARVAAKRAQMRKDSAA